MLADDEIAELLAVTVPRLNRRLGPGAWPAADVEDLVQDALERALVLERAGREIRSLPAWTQAVVLNLRRDEWRRLEAEARALDRAAARRDPGAGGPADGDGAGADDDLLDHLRTLPARQRQVLTLHYYADMPVDVIARRLGVDPGTVKSTLHRGRRALAALVRPPAPAPVPVPVPAAAETSPTPPPAPQEAPMDDPIPGWMMAGSHPHQYRHGILDGEERAGGRVGYMRCTADEPGGFGTLMQIVDARSYRGSRIRFSGEVRPREARWAGLWMRVDEPTGRFSAFDNMERRPITGTGDWARHDVVLHVGQGSAAIAFGVLLGAGEVHVAGMRFEEVGDDVPTTGGRLPAAPRNLDLSESAR